MWFQCKLNENKSFGEKSELYGRVTRQLEVKPLKFKHIFEWFNVNFENALKLWSVTSGIPKYLEFFEGKDIEGEIIKNFFDPTRFLYNDAINILSEELRDYSTYFQILEAISLGHTRPTEIANYAFISPKDVFFYLDVLKSLGIVKRELPIISPKKAKRGIYKIIDNYFRFWFRFVSPYQSDIESYNSNVAINNFKKQFNSYLGEIFEDLVIDVLKNTLNLKIGKWWHKGIEIDILGVKEKEILVGEVKWKENLDGEKILSDLREKVNYLPKELQSKKIKYLVVGKSFKKKLENCWDLKDLERLIYNQDTSK